MFQLSLIAQVLLGIFILRCLLVYSYRVLFHPLRSYPGPLIAKMTDWYGAYHAIRLRLHLVTYNDHQKYGSVVRQGPNKLIFNSAQALHDIYKNDRILKAKSYRATQPGSSGGSGGSIFNIFNVIDRQVHRVKRRIIGQGLNERAMRHFEPVMNEQVNIFLKKLVQSSKQAESVDMTQRCGWLGMDISGLLAFGRGFDLQTSSKNHWLPQGIWTTNHRLNTYMQFPQLKYTGWEKLLLPIVLPKVKRWHRLVEGLINARLSEDIHARPDLFSSVAEYKDPESGKGMPKRELWSESTFFIPAGGDTTTTLMAASFFYLSRYPRVYQRLSEEVRSTFGQASEIKSGKTLSSCTYLRAFLEECLRMSPPVGTTLWREAPADSKNSPVVVDGYSIPPGTQIGVNVYALHHNEEYFPEPFAFKPERWLAEENEFSAEKKKLMNYAFSPFSIGARACAGKAMAYLEPSLVLSKTLWYFDFERASDDVQSGEDLVFRTGDQLGSRHAGPKLRFRARGEAWKELFGEK